MRSAPPFVSISRPAPVIDPMIARRNAIKDEFTRKREELVKRRAEIAKEIAEIELAKASANEAIVPLKGDSKLVLLHELGEKVVDYTAIPTQLDAALEKLDEEGSLRPSIINVGKVWTKRSQAGLLAAATSKGVDAGEQKLEKQACFDLLDGLTKSGSAAFGFDGATLHIVVSSTHSFEKNVMDTLVRDNVNPIAKIEHSALIVASSIFGRPAGELLVESARERIAAQSPALFLKQQ